MRAAWLTFGYRSALVCQKSLIHVIQWPNCTGFAQTNSFQLNTHFIIDYQHHFLAQYSFATHSMKQPSRRTSHDSPSIQKILQQKLMNAQIPLNNETETTNEYFYSYTYSHVLARFCSNKYRTNENTFFLYSFLF